MDNRNIYITSDQLQHIKYSIDIAQTNSKAVGYAIINVYATKDGDHFARALNVESGKGTSVLPCLVFFWSDFEASSRIPEYQKLPFEYSNEDMHQMTIGWLKSLGKKYFDADIDGDCGIGFIAFTNYWGNVMSMQSSIVGFVPTPAMYGK